MRTRWRSWPCGGATRPRSASSTPTSPLPRLTARGTSKAAVEEYVTGIATVLARSKAALRPGAPVCIVVNDRRGLYPELLDRAGLRLDERLERHVNRRTGRRAGEYFESILICR